MSETQQQAGPKWQPLNRIERRIVGVLVEKAKTTPNAYPLTLNALTTGCNQKSNRDPEMNLEPHQVEDALENLRKLGAVAEVSGSGRAPKYRHYMYEWLGVEKAELSVMAELLLRGTQTVGELRGRAARMDPIADLAALQPLLQSLMNKGLVISLSPEGRGQIVTHGLYRDEELENVKRRATDSDGASERAAASAPTPTASAESITPSADIEGLRHEVAELRAELGRLKSEVDDIWSNIR